MNDCNISALETRPMPYCDEHKQGVHDCTIKAKDEKILQLEYKFSELVSSAQKHLNRCENDTEDVLDKSLKSSHADARGFVERIKAEGVAEYKEKENHFWDNLVIVPDDDSESRMEEGS